MGDVGGGVVGTGGVVGEDGAEGDPAVMEEGGRDNTLGFQAFGLRRYCFRTPVCQVGGVRRKGVRDGVVGGDVWDEVGGR